MATEVPKTTPSAIPQWPETAQPQAQALPDLQDHTVPMGRSDGDIPTVDTQPNSPSPRSSFFFAESAALLFLFSFFIFVEGSIRLDSYRGVAFAAGDFPTGVFVAASICEIIFALLGILLGLAALICRFFNNHLLMFAATLQVVLSVYVFAVYNFALPLYHIVNQHPELPVVFVDLDVNVGYFFLGILALLTAIHFTLALFVGQLLFFFRLSTSGTGKDSWFVRKGNRIQAMFWNLNLFLSGVWTFGFGIVAELDEGNYFEYNPNVDCFFAWNFFFEFFFPPHIGTRPGLTIATGIVMMAWAIIGTAVANLRLREHRWYMIASIFVVFFVYLNFTLAQFSVPELNLGSLFFGGFLTKNLVLVFATMFMPIYYLYRAKEQEDETHEL